MKPIHLARALLYRVGAALCAVYGAWSWVTGPRPRPPLPAHDALRILAIRLDLMGDVVFSIPAIEALARAYPQATIDVLALPYTAQLLRGVSAVTHVHTIDVNQFRRPQGWRCAGQLVAMVRLLRANRYDVAIGLSGLMGGVFAVASGARWRVGYQDETYPGCYNLPVAGRRYDRPQHEVEYCLDLARRLGIQAASERPALASGNRMTGTSGARPYAVIVPGASNGSAKRWPAVHWAALGDTLAERQGLEIVLSGAPSEHALAEDVASAMHRPARNVAGSTSMEELMDLLYGAAIVVAGDTGPLHVAAALGRPVVGLFGPTDPVNTGSLAQNGGVVRIGLACSPCYDLRSPADCKLPDRSIRCMWELTPSLAYAAVERVLDRAERQRAATQIERTEAVEQSA